MKKRLLVILGILFLIVIAGVLWIKNANNFQREGTLQISGNEQAIKIVRDEHGIAYVIAKNKADVYRGQGFVTAQDRLFPIEFYRAIIKGEAAAILGTSMLTSDIDMRVLNIYDNAERHFQYLDAETKEVLQWYCDGFNAYLDVGKDEFPLELGLLGMEPKPLTPLDIVSVTHFIGLFHSQNLNDELLSLNLASQVKEAAELLPLAVNLDRTKPLNFSMDSLPALESNAVKEVAFVKKPSPMIPYPEFGSNNWAISSQKSKSGKPILANDPHMDARVLPGTFYPIGLICPDFKAVGIATPGIPGLISGRNEFVAFGITNAYGDSQDLFIENVEGDFFFQDSVKVPLTIRKEQIVVKDSADVTLTIRSTKRGPIISDFPIYNIQTDDVVSFKWSLAESKSGSVGFHRLLDAKSVLEMRETLYDMDNMFFNFVMADVEGNIAHQATGLVPVRTDKTGLMPKKVDEGGTWNGFIPKNELPHMVNPERGWVGTANHDTRPDGYPYYYSNHFSPFYRYQRMKEVLSANDKMEADDLWELIFDVKNMQAVKLTPIFVNALKEDNRTAELSSILAEWNRKDDISEVGASVYNVLYNELLYLILNDELPDALENQYWDNVYYWNQRLDSLMLTDHAFIDNRETPQTEHLADLIIDAGIRTEQILTEKLGDNKQNWQWGKLHTVYFYNPIRRTGFGSGLLGAELLPKQGSNQTINRGGFFKNAEHNFDTSWFSSFRMVADMSDPEKIRGVVSGGSSARMFHPYYKSQLEQWKTKEWIPYWISEDRIMEHAEFELILE